LDERRNWYQCAIRLGILTRGAKSDVKNLCDGYRWTDDVNGDNNGDENGDTENFQAMQQWLSRSLTWNEASNGNTKIQINLPPELAQAFLNSVEQSLNQTDITSANASQRRADAAVLMAEKNLRGDWESFDSVRKLMPSVYWFRVFDADGEEVGG